MLLTGYYTWTSFFFFYLFPFYSVATNLYSPFPLFLCRQAIRCCPRHAQRCRGRRPLCLPRTLYSPFPLPARNSLLSSPCAEMSRSPSAMSSRSRSSSVPYRERPLEYALENLCHFNMKARRWISLSLGNPGRRYYNCSKLKVKKNCFLCTLCKISAFQLIWPDTFC